MTWIDQALDEISLQPTIGYLPGSNRAAEPTAFAALALWVHGRGDAAKKTADTLASMQQTSGEVSVRVGEQSPGWPTSQAISAWCAIDLSSYQSQIKKAVAWLLANRGCTVERSEDFGHNTELVGWAYAEQTHSWVEPTAMAVLALKAAARIGPAVTSELKLKPDDPKIRYQSVLREGVSVLIDRQLPGGGLNYGNTIVLGQFIRPHVEPTGIGLIALAGENDRSGRIIKSVAWLRRSIGPQTTPLSLAWGLLGLRAHGIELLLADEWLAAAASRVQDRDRSPYKLALLALAAKGWPA